MNGFEPGVPVVGSDRSAKCATATAPHSLFLSLSVCPFSPSWSWSWSSNPESALSSSSPFLWTKIHRKERTFDLGIDKHCCWVPPQLSGFVCAYHPATPGFPSTPSTLLSFKVNFLLYLSCENNENKQKRGRVWPILKIFRSGGENPRLVRGSWEVTHKQEFVSLNLSSW